MPIPLAAVAAAGAAGLQAAGPIAGYFGGERARRYQRRELREIMNLRYALGQQFLNPEEDARMFGRLASLAVEPPFDKDAYSAIDRDLEARLLGQSVATERSVGQNLAAMGVDAPGIQSAIESEIAHTRRVMANMARSQAGIYGRSQNIQQLEQGRQAFAEGVSGRYGTLATILAAGV